MTTKQNAENARDGSGIKNFDTFRAMRDELLKSHPGQFALFHGGEFVGVFPDRYKARRYADKRFPNSACLLKELTNRPVRFTGFRVARKPNGSEELPPMAKVDRETSAVTR